MDNSQRLKKIVEDEIENHKEQYVTMSQKIFNHPEVGNQEFMASQLLIECLKENGFDVKLNISNHPTGFIGIKKGIKKGPIIGLLAEYDALKGLGHACGHHLIALMSLSAAIGIGAVLEETGGEVRIFGCPAEEGGEFGSAKESYVKDHIFDGVDVCMMIHPFEQTAPTPHSLAIKKFKVMFHGKASHAASAPEKGINALDAMILFYNAINALRQHVTHDVLIHGIITHGGDAPNIVPHYTEASFYIRSNYSKRCDEIFEKVLHIGQGAAIATGCTFEYNDQYNRVKELLQCPTFDQLFIDETTQYGLRVELEHMKTIGSTDAGNVSLVLPTIHPTIKICEDGVAIHTEEFKAFANTDLGYERMIIGGKILASIGVRLLLDTEKLQDIKKEFEQNREKHYLLQMS